MIHVFVHLTNAIFVILKQIATASLEINSIDFPPGSSWFPLSEGYYLIRSEEGSVRYLSDLTALPQPLSRGILIASARRFQAITWQKKKKSWNNTFPQSLFCWCCCGVNHQFPGLDWIRVFMFYSSMENTANLLWLKHKYCTKEKIPTVFHDILMHWMCADVF